MATTIARDYKSLARKFFSGKCIACNNPIHTDYLAKQLSEFPEAELGSYLLFVKNKGAICCSCYQKAINKDFIKSSVNMKIFRKLKKQVRVCPICGKKGRLNLKRVKYSRSIYVYPYMAHFNGRLSWCYIPVELYKRLIKREVIK